MGKLLKYHQTLNLPPRSIKHGQHRKASPPAHGDPIVRTDHSAGGTSQAGSLPLSSWNITAWTFDAFTFDKPKPPALPNAGIRTGEIIGHRLWWVIPENGSLSLCSLVHKRLWTPGETIEGDTSEIVDHDPFFMHVIWGGVYAFATAEQLRADIESLEESVALIRKAMNTVFGWSPFKETRTFVAGTIKMWGDVVEHETGYRAQYAKLHSIDRAFGDPIDFDQLQTRYGVR